jgi:hypothetical protein
MKLVYLGADVPSNRVILESMGIKNVGVSYWRLVKRGLPKNKRYLLSNYFQPYMDIHVHPGIPENTILTEAELEQFAIDYEDFLSHNMDRITSFIEIDHPQLDKLSMNNQREAAWAEEDKFWATIRADHSYGEIVDMCQQYENVAIPYSIIEGDVSMAAKTRALSTQYKTKFHALACAKPDNLRQIHVETASTMSWLSPMMRGETIVWDGTKLVRYPKKMKDQARPRYKAIYEKAGLDFDKILNDDPVEVAKLALWSYDQYEERFNMANNPFLNPEDDDKDVYYTTEDLPGGLIAEITPPVHDMKGVEMRKLIQRDVSEMGTLPVFGTEYKSVVEQDENGNDVIKDVPIMRSSDVSLRMCNTCFVAANCPAFKQDNSCAFSLPVKVETKEQLRALLTAIIEMQGQRVAFARFAEEMNGGYPDPNTSQEMDRLFKLVKVVKDLEETSSFVRMTVEAKNGGGVLSQIFGEKASTLNELPNGGLNENQVTRIIQQGIEE